MVGEDVITQIRQAFENMKAGAMMDDITKLTVFLTDVDDLPKYTEVMGGYLPIGHLEP